MLMVAVTFSFVGRVSFMMYSLTIIVVRVDKQERIKE